MGYFHTQRGVEEYVEMAKGFDGAQLIDMLRSYLPAGSSVLELGMGPGVDLDILARTYEVVGSDYSQLFLDRYRKSHPGADLLLLDATAPETDRRFDCIFSNKVLHHLTREELRVSLEAQADLLNAAGLAIHSFWHGDKEDELMQGLRFVYYTEQALIDLVSDAGFEIIELKKYAEMEPEDSIVVLLRKLAS